ncbi:MAG: hypothetical protein IEMM0002_1529 [bacterium]|nr:MAG: hypothetical protein IEMM0002_1529 [bacterium]
MPFSGKRLSIQAACLVILWTACSSRPATLLQEAENLWFKNHYREAVRVFLQVADRYPDTQFAETALLKIGEIFMLNLSEPDKAVEYFTRVTIEFPDSGGTFIARNFMASIYEKSLRDYDHAIIQYQKLKDSKDTRRDEYQFAIGRCYYSKGDFRQAIIEYRTLLTSHPNSKLIPEAQYEIGNSYFVMNNCEEAKKQYRKTLEEYPDIEWRSDILLSLGICLEEKEEYGQALQLYKGLLDKYHNKALIKKKVDSVLARMKDKNR